MLRPRLIHLASSLCLAFAGWMVYSGFLFQPASAMALPPRSTPTPASHSHPNVAAIAVTVSNPPPGAWVGVQWQDPWGGWHDVESWPGELVGDWTVRWVLSDDFGDGPFRWIVLESQGGRIWAISSPFYFPRSRGEWVWSSVTTATPTVTPTWIRPTRPTPTGPTPTRLTPTGPTPTRPTPTRPTATVTATSRRVTQTAPVKATP